MDVELRRLRNQLATNRGEGPRRPRFPLWLREQVADFARRRSERGSSLWQVADELGLNRSTVQLWSRRYPGSQGRSRLRRVEVGKSELPSPTLGAATPVLILADGSRIEGLTLESLITVLRELR